MNTWYCPSENRHSFYVYPITWNKLLSLFDSNALCSVEHFIGWKHGQTIYKAWHGCSHDLFPMKTTISLHDLKSLVRRSTKWQYEYKIKIGCAYIERGVTGGIVFTSDSLTILSLAKKLGINNELLNPEYECKLISVGKKNSVTLLGEFLNWEALHDHIYLELMKKLDPGYEKFMAALDSAQLE